MGRGHLGGHLAAAARQLGQIGRDDLRQARRAVGCGRPPGRSGVSAHRRRLALRASEAMALACWSLRTNHRAGDQVAQIGAFLEQRAQLLESSCGHAVELPAAHPPVRTEPRHIARPSRPSLYLQPAKLMCPQKRSFSSHLRPRLRPTFALTTCPNSGQDVPSPQAGRSYHTPWSLASRTWGRCRAARKALGFRGRIWRSLRLLRESGLGAFRHLLGARVA